MQGGLYNSLLRALERLGLADVYGRSRVPLYVMNVAYPLVDAEVLRFCAGKRAVLMVEEGQPNFIEQSIASVLRQADAADRAARQGHAADGRRIHRGRSAARALRAFLERATGACAELPVAAAAEGDPAAQPLTTTCTPARRASAPAARSGRSSPR